MSSGTQVAGDSGHSIGDEPGGVDEGDSIWGHHSPCETTASMRKNRGFETCAWGAVVYTIGVILWGAYVRATGSGAGCGDHWPLCDGEVIPRAPDAQKLIEYTHRVTSGLCLIFVALLYAWSRKISAAAGRVGSARALQRAAGWSLVLMLIEAALGAGLVLLALVAQDQSLMRVVSIGTHLVNTLFLLSAMTLTALWAGVQEPVGDWRRERLPSPRLAWGSLAGFIAIGATGAITALGDTLFPPGDTGVLAQLEQRVHILQLLRVFHPFIAVAMGGLILAWAYPSRERPLSTCLCLAIITNICVGVLNVGLQAPVWMQMLHLAVADLAWVLAVALFFAEGRASAARVSG